MTARSPHEPHRASTPLELLFDLVFVVAIAQVASGLHHAISEAHAAAGLSGYAMVFFAIWWAWMNFTWFASAYDCDDVPYRLAVFVQITGALILAAGVPAMFETHTPNLAVIVGYVVMRLAMVGQWLRAAASDPERRTTAVRYAIGITLLQIAWVGMFWIPQYWGPGFVALVVAELLVPAWAERAGQTTWHPHHIAERYGLLTLIVLGESILSATVAIQSALASGEALVVADSPDRGRAPHCLLDVVDVFRSAGARPPHQSQDCPRLGIRPLSRVRGRGGRWRGAGRQRRLCNASRQDQCRRCWSRRRHPRRHFHPLLVVPSRSARLSAVTGFGPVAAIAILLTPLSGQRRSARWPHPRFCHRHQALHAARRLTIRHDAHRVGLHAPVDRERPRRRAVCRRDPCGPRCRNHAARYGRRLLPRR